MESGFAVTNGIRMHYLTEGKGDLVLFLHGFPEFSHTWRHQLPAMAGAGYRAVAPDLRGWGETDKPRGVAAYRTTELVKDIAGLIRALGYDRAHVVGHDWGGALAWLVAHWHPEVTQSITALNAPHPEGYLRVLKEHPRQRLLSWYILFFQIPWLPDALFRLAPRRAVREAFRTVHPGAITEADLAAFAENMGRPYAVTAGLNYYRALVRSGPIRGLKPLAMPAQAIWGEQDRFLVRANVEAARPWAPGLTVRYIPDASHWVHWDRPDLVNRYLLEFICDGSR